MEPFLKQVAVKYLTGPEISSYCFIFPNRRSSAFFRKYLAESASFPFVAPKMVTINELFCRGADVEPMDRVNQLLVLYDCYKELNPNPEPLDEFFFWGDVILSDFNDVDKWLADPKQLYANVSDLKEIQDSYSYLTDNQREAIAEFLSHFSGRNGKLSADIFGESPVKGRFWEIWRILHPLYVSFREALSARGAAYEGMIYRALADKVSEGSVKDVLGRMFPRTEKFIFVGLNALNECEKVLLRKMRDAGIAEFCWDYSGPMITDSCNRSSFFMSRNVEEFPQAGQWDGDALGTPRFRVVSVPSSVGQAKCLPEIFKEIASSQTGGDLSKVGRLEDDGADCAVVLPDEALLMPVLNTIPPEIGDINVTMGYPMSSGALYSLVSDLISLQIHSVSRGGRTMFYHRQVWSVFSNGIFRRAAAKEVEDVVVQVKKNAKYYVPEDDLRGSALTELLFRRVVDDPKSDSPLQIRNLEKYLLEIISYVATAMKDDGGMALELEFAKECYRSVNMLLRIDLPVRPQTYAGLLDSLLGGVSVPFSGEPLKGLQIMGPLETRALDFRNVVILSSNEGMFPKRNVSSSFIPPELRKGFGLPTYEFQDAVWAYYFYRLVTRAENVWMLYDSRTEGMKQGEESRYIKQLQYHFNIPLERYVATSAVSVSSVPAEIPKTEEDMEAIRKIWYSATAVQNYLACPAKFYYSSVKMLKTQEEVAGSIDNAMFGNVYHDTMYCLYCGEEAMAAREPVDKRFSKYVPMRRIAKDYLQGWRRREKEIKEKVDSFICLELNSFEVSGRDLVVSDVIVRYVLKTIDRDIEQMGQRDSFELYGLELELTGELEGHRFIGYIDRLDGLSSCGDAVRVVDYKTGKVSDRESGEINGQNAAKTVDALFNGNSQSRPKILLQFFIYDFLVRQNRDLTGKRLQNCVYSVSDMFKDIPRTNDVCDVFCGMVEERLLELLAEIDSPEKPFSRTDDLRVCEYCDFRMICGR
ncbi:MAG: PD-(D/E)XK nuclease family protein [Candidatus Cryptobacteroides sp.]